MMGFIFFIFALLGAVFIWSAAGFIYSVKKLSNDPSDGSTDCKVCEYLCNYSSSITFQEQILLFPNLVIAFVACKLINCDCK